MDLSDRMRWSSKLFFEQRYYWNPVLLTVRVVRTAIYGRRNAKLDKKARINSDKKKQFIFQIILI